MSPKRGINLGIFQSFAEQLNNFSVTLAMSHSFTHDVFSPAGVFIHTSCVGCACLPGSPQAAQPCPNPQKLLTEGPKLSSGLPRLVQNLSLSPPSVPPEAEHASCKRIVRELPCATDISKVADASNTMLGMAHTGADGSKCFIYGSEDDIVFCVRLYMMDIINALELDLQFNAEIAIKHIRPDLCVLLLGKYLVGVVDVKKPGENVLHEPTVLGELLDQMFVVEGFYGMGPVIGILITGDELLIAWFPVDQIALEQCEGRMNKALFTPVKPPRDSTALQGRSPPGGTPSQKAGTVHFIEDIDAAADAVESDNDEVQKQMVRELCTTEVVSMHAEPIRALQMLCSAFELMAMSHTGHNGNLSRCLLKFHKGISAVTFHPASYDLIQPLVDFNRFPTKTVKNLVALEDLGRGSSGKAWLCVTLTKPRSAACVLKFDNKGTNGLKLLHEKEMWDLVYPEFSCMVRVELWSGADALVMPHFSTVLENERELYKDELEEVLRNKFMARSRVHSDVRWRNIGKYRTKDDSVQLVVYDLHDVVEYNHDVHSSWIEKAMNHLYGK